MYGVVKIIDGPWNHSKNYDAYRRVGSDKIQSRISTIAHLIGHKSTQAIFLS